jgi:hypothetical protein
MGGELMYKNQHSNNNFFDTQQYENKHISLKYKMEPYLSIYDEIYNPVRQEQKKMNTSKNILELNNVIRKLWTDHVIWTKMAISSIVNDTPDKKNIEKRLLRNPEDFEKLFAEYFNFTIAKKFSELLKEHLLIAADLVIAAKNENKNEINMLNEKWYKNAEEIAEFLSSINQYWNKKEMEQMMFKHLELVLAQAVSIIDNKYEDSIKLFDETMNQALKMADTYTEGFIKKFPEKFM